MCMDGARVASSVPEVFLRLCILFLNSLFQCRLNQ
jgi:hypothetical protein